MNQHGRNRATAFVQTGLDNYATAWSRWSGLEFQNFSLQQDGFEQLVNASTHFRRDRNKRSVTTPLFRGHAVDGQLAADAIEVSTWLVDFVHCNHQRHASCFRMLYSFDGLRHDAVVSSHNQNHDVSCLGTTCTHCGKRSVTRGIEERNHAAFGFNVVCTDVLSNTTGFASSYFGTTDVVEQGRFTVVNVAHYGHNRCTGERLAFKLQGLGQGIFQGVVANQSHFVAQFLSNQLSSFLIQYLVDGRWRTQLEHELDDFSSLDRHLCSQIADSDGLANLHVTNYRAGWALETVSVALLQLALATTTATEAVAFFVGSARSNTWSRCFFFNRCAMRCVLAIAVTTAATIVIVSAWFVRATLFITFACISGRRWCCSHCCLHRCRCRDSRSCCWSRCRCRLTARVFFGATADIALAGEFGALRGGGFGELGQGIELGAVERHFTASEHRVKHAVRFANHLGPDPVAWNDCELDGSWHGCSFCVFGVRSLA